MEGGSNMLYVEKSKPFTTIKDALEWYDFNKDWFIFDDTAIHYGNDGLMYFHILVEE